VKEFWSIGVLCQCSNAPRDREVGDAAGALGSVPETRKTLNKQTVGTTYLPPLSGRIIFGPIPGVKTPGLVLLSPRDKIVSSPVRKIEATPQFNGGLEYWARRI
jgi:hypothetical protein